MTKIFTGNSAEILKELPDAIVHCIVTSPPYFGLRDYGTAQWIGGDASCDHKHQCGGNGVASSKQNTSVGTQTIMYHNVCAKCGAKRKDNQIGLENTPDEYIRSLMTVLTEARRVLRDDGTLWLNLGDTYAGGGCHDPGPNNYKQKTNVGSCVYGRNKQPRDQNLKPKDLMGIPWRVALALQGHATIPYRSLSKWADDLKLARESQDWEAVKIIEDRLRHHDLLNALQSQGWWLRQDIIYSKTDAMPESVLTRCVKSHEYMFLLAKSKYYYFDIEAIKEDSVKTKSSNKLSTWGNNETIIRKDGTGAVKTQRGVPWQGIKRSKRSVWHISKGSYKFAHFATYPVELVLPCIMAGTSEHGCCPKCGTPWSRVIESIRGNSTECPKTQASHEARGGIGTPTGTVGKSGGGRTDSMTSTLGWKPGCKCYGLDIIDNPTNPPLRRPTETDDAYSVRMQLWATDHELWQTQWNQLKPQYDEAKVTKCIVLDPFGGSGTTAVAAESIGRNTILVELNPEYVKIAEDRILSSTKNVDLAVDGQSAP
jgi:DNA modification methylase